MRKAAITGQRHNKAYMEHTVTRYYNNGNPIKTGKVKQSKKARLKARKEAKSAGTPR